MLITTRPLTVFFSMSPESRTTHRTGLEHRTNHTYSKPQTRRARQVLASLRPRALPNLGPRPSSPNRGCSPPRKSPPPLPNPPVNSQTRCYLSAAKAPTWPSKTPALSAFCSPTSPAPLKSQDVLNYSSVYAGTVLHECRSYQKRGLERRRLLRMR